jgi:hypothetical protein
VGNGTKMDVKNLALILLLLRIVAIFLLGLVINRQIELIRRNNPDYVQSTRKLMLSFSLALLVGNLIPFVVDILTLAVDIPRSSATVNVVGVVYSLSNAVTSVVYSLLLTILYMVRKYQK